MYRAAFQRCADIITKIGRADFRRTIQRLGVVPTSGAFRWIELNVSACFEWRYIFCRRTADGPPPVLGLR